MNLDLYFIVLGDRFFHIYKFQNICRSIFCVYCRVPRYSPTCVPGNSSTLGMQVWLILRWLVLLRKCITTGPEQRPVTATLQQ